MKLIITIPISFIPNIGMISYLTALKNHPDEMETTNILSLTGQGNGNGNMEVIGMKMYLEIKIRLKMF